MDDQLKVPDTLEMTFNRVLQRVPTDKRNDIELQKSILLFLKLGGERLARARIKPVISPFPDSNSVVKPRPLPTLLDPIEADLDDENDLSEKEDESSEAQV